VSARTKISVFILVVLALHALPVLSYQGAQQTRWPFLVWAMYARSTPPGPIVAFVNQLFAVLPDGTVRKINYKDVGMSAPALAAIYTRPFSRGDSTAGRWLVDRLNRLGPDSVVQVGVRVIRYRLVDSGIAVDTLPDVVYPPTTPTTTR
jgi:hypothetical protein